MKLRKVVEESYSATEIPYESRSGGLSGDSVLIAPNETYDGTAENLSDSEEYAWALDPCQVYCQYFLFLEEVFP